MPASGFHVDMVRAILADEIGKARKPVLVLYLGVGMVPQVIGLASLRLAPIQCVSFGHTATTMSPAMDYFMLPEDFRGLARVLCFSERRCWRLPKAAMPFAPRPVPLHVDALTSRSTDGKVRVAVPASDHEAQPAAVRRHWAKSPRGRQVAGGIPVLFSAGRHRHSLFRTLPKRRERNAIPRRHRLRGSAARAVLWSGCRAAICSSARSPTGT